MIWLILALLFLIVFTGLAVFVAKLFLIAVLIVLIAGALGGYRMRGGA